MSWLESLVRSPVKVSVGVLIVLLFGGIALTSMPMQLTPDVEPPVITVSSRWRGASPSEIEKQIIRPQEEVLKTVEGVKRMDAMASPTMARVTLEFAVGTDLPEALLKVNTRLQQVTNYPETAKPPVISTANLADRAVAMYVLQQRPPSAEEMEQMQEAFPHLAKQIAAIQKKNSALFWLPELRALAKDHIELYQSLPLPIDTTKLRTFAEDVIGSGLERINGVSNAEFWGGKNSELQVLINPQRLASRQLTVEQVRQALVAANQDTSAGDFAEGKRRYVVRTVGQFRSPEDVGAVIVGKPDGIPVYLRDVAEVRLGYSKPEGAVRFLSDSCIAIGIRRESSANLLDVMNRARAYIDELNGGILQRKGLILTPIFDETGYIYASLGMVTENIVLAVCLTVLTLIVFLRSFRSTLVIGVAIPVSVIGTFWAMQMMGRTLNVISLAGLAFAVGMLVDNAIVVLENIFRHHQLGKRPLEAAVQGTREVWGAVLASTITTLAVFVPVIFVQEEVGQLFRDIALAICFAVSLSLVVSIFVVPAFTAYLLGIERENTEQTRTGLLARAWAGWLRLISPMMRLFDRLGTSFVEWVVALNRWVQTSALRELAISGAVVAAAMVACVMLRPKVEYLPSGNQNMVHGRLVVPPAYNLEEMLRLGTDIEDKLQPLWARNDSEATLPDGSPAIKNIYYLARNKEVYFGCSAVDPVRAGELEPILRKVVRDIPGTKALVSQANLFERGRGGGRTVRVEISGPELKRLVALGDKVLDLVAQAMPTAQAAPNSSLEIASPELRILPRREQASDMGVSARELGFTVDALVDGAYATDYFLDGERIDLTLVGETKWVERTQDMKVLPISTPTGDLVPLAAVADVEWSTGPQLILRAERQRAVSIDVSPPSNMPLEEAIDIINAQVVAPLEAEGELDGLYQIRLSGTADKLMAAWGALWMNLIVSALITYLLMAALFESWIYPFAIMLSVPVGAVGGILGLALINGWVEQPLDVITMLGFIMLIGIVVNNPILIVDQSLNLMREQGMNRGDAIAEALRNRIRPIFMTTGTTVLGLLPLVLSPGAGSELYRGLGGVVLGGLVVSTVVTLFLVPIAFDLLLRMRESFARLTGIRQSI